MAQIGRRNPTKLRLDLGCTSHSSGSSTSDSAVGGGDGSNSNDTWRQDLARIVDGSPSEHRLDELKADDLQQLQRLGSGNAGVVWKVKHKPTGRIMAKKVHRRLSGCICMNQFPYRNGVLGYQY